MNLIINLMRKISPHQGLNGSAGTFKPGFSRNFIQFVVNFLIDYAQLLLLRGLRLRWKLMSEAEQGAG
jgi:hypothetical protein